MESGPALAPFWLPFWTTFGVRMQTFWGVFVIRVFVKEFGLVVDGFWTLFGEWKWCFSTGGPSHDSCWAVFSFWMQIESDFSWCGDVLESHFNTEFLQHDPFRSQLLPKLSLVVHGSHQNKSTNHISLQKSNKGAAKLRAIKSSNLVWLNSSQLEWRATWWGK